MRAADSWSKPPVGKLCHLNCSGLVILDSAVHVVWWRDQTKNWSSVSLTQVGKFKTCAICCFRSPLHRLEMLRVCEYRYIKILYSDAEICSSSGSVGTSLLWLNLGLGIYTLVLMTAYFYHQSVTTTDMDWLHCFLAPFSILIHQT